MNQSQALALFSTNNCHMIVVENIKSGVRYVLERCVVEQADEEFVYGHYVNRNPRRRGTYRWFFLKSVRFVEVHTA